MIAEFTNVKGEVNRGEVIDIDPSGLLQIAWEPFTSLTNRVLATKPQQQEILMESMGKRTGWSRIHGKNENGSTLIVITEANDSPELTKKYKEYTGE